MRTTTILLIFIHFIMSTPCKGDENTVHSPAEHNYLSTVNDLSLSQHLKIERHRETLDLLTKHPNESLKLLTLYQLAQLEDSKQGNNQEWINSLQSIEPTDNIALKEFLVLSFQFHHLYSLNQFKESVALADDIIVLISQLQPTIATMTKGSTALVIKKEIANTLKNLGKAYYLVGQYENSQIQFISALKWAELINDQRLASQLLNNLSVIAWAQNDVEKALTYLDRGLEISIALGDTKSYLSKLSNKGIYLSRLKRFNASRAAFEQALAHQDINKYPKLKVNTLIALSEFLSLQNSLEDAQSLAQEALTISQSLNDEYGESNVKMVMANVLLSAEEYQEAIDILVDVESFYREKKLQKELMSALSSLSRAYSGINNHKLALESFNEFHQIYSELSKQAQNQSVNELMAKYESDFKEKQIQILQQENIIKNNQKEAAEQQAKNTKILSIGSAIILTLLLIGFYTYRERKRLIKYTQEIEAREKQLILLSNAFKSTSDGVWITDKDFYIQVINDAFVRITGRKNAIGQKMGFSNIKGQNEAFTQQILTTIKSKGSWSGEAYDQNVDGDIYPIEIKIESIKDEEGNVIHYLGAFRDISKRREIEEKLVKLATQDILTGLPNRTLFTELIQHSLKRAARDKLIPVVYSIDIDGFKTLNESLGHRAGGKLIQTIASRLKETLREKDVIARLEGDKFAVLTEISDTKAESASVAKKIIKAFAKPMELEGSFYKISLSIGIATYPDDASEAEELLRKANIAMITAKSLGKNVFQFFEDKMNDTARQLLEQEQRLIEAIENDQFLFHYQPIINLYTNTVTGAEALIRWQESNDRLIYPDNFIPLAEKLGIISEIDQIVINKVFNQLSYWEQKGIHLETVSINLSANIFSTPKRLLKLLKTAIKKYQINPRSIKLELTEGMLVDSIDVVKQTMHDLKNLGFTLAIDDFGTGFSSLNYLKEFPLDVLKVDRTFIMNMHESKRDRSIVRTIIELAHNLDFKVTAEGVEIEQHVRELKEMQCEEYQGYYFSKPISTAEFEKLVS